MEVSPLQEYVVFSITLIKRDLKKIGCILNVGVFLIMNKSFENYCWPFYSYKKYI